MWGVLYEGSGTIWKTHETQWAPVFQRTNVWRSNPRLSTTECEKFTDTVSDPTVQSAFQKSPCVEFWFNVNKKCALVSEKTIKISPAFQRHVCVRLDFLYIFQSKILQQTDCDSGLHCMNRSYETKKQRREPSFPQWSRTLKKFAIHKTMPLFTSLNL